MMARVCEKSISRRVEYQNSRGTVESCEFYYEGFEIFTERISREYFVGLDELEILI